jgi:hypothetical protein
VNAVIRARAHGNTQPRIGRELVEDGCRQPRGLAAEDEHVVGAEGTIEKRAPAACGQRVPTARVVGIDCDAAGRPVAMDPKPRVLVIIETGALELTVAEPKTQRLDQMQLRARVRRQPDDVAGIRRDLGMNQDDREHRSFAATRCPGARLMTGGM